MQYDVSQNRWLWWWLWLTSPWVFLYVTFRWVGNTRQDKIITCHFCCSCSMSNLRICWRSSEFYNTNCLYWEEYPEHSPCVWEHITHNSFVDFSQKLSVESRGLWELLVCGHLGMGPVALGWNLPMIIELGWYWNISFHHDYDNGPNADKSVLLAVICEHQTWPPWDAAWNILKPHNSMLSLFKV